MTEDWNTALSTGTVHYADLMYLVSYTVYEHRLEVTVYETLWNDIDSKPVLRHINGFGGPAPSVEEAEPFWSGTIKWDGCSNWNNPDPYVSMHFCERSDLTDFGELMGRLWDLASELVPTSICKGDYKR